MKTKQSFASLMDELGHDHDLATLFDDFLTVAIGISGNDFLANKTSGNSPIQAALEKYQDNSIRFHFAQMQVCLIEEMLKRQGSAQGNDVLGEYYETRLLNLTSAKPLMPYDECGRFARKTIDQARKHLFGSSLNFLDYSCRTGRILMAAGEQNLTKENYFGVDTNPTYVKIAALNLYLNGFRNSEVLCRHELLPKDFRVSYIISRKPTGIFELTDKKESLLWHMLTESPLAHIPFGKPMTNLN